MPAPKNPFKARLAAGKPQIGLWMGLANAYTAEICAGAGFDWLVIDGEHAPNDLQRMVGQLQALAGYPVATVIRAPVGETWILKQLLDIGAQSLLVPMVESGAQAAALVEAVRYPPRGKRGVGAALARSSAFNRIGDYLTTADEEICLIVQVESQKALAALPDIAAVEGVDAVFVGPSDLAADMGYLGRPGAPAVKQAVRDAIATLQRLGKPAGLLTADQTFARECLADGARFVAVGTDVTLFSGATSALAQSFRDTAPARSGETGGY
ncbi:4-hydroxy-2-oxoheptanedioate aldolase [Stappia taiwanensis]|uniref:4-hydroxy-2-oxoheptanedioate aldolase n=1 Tax=Stappia taiwanensis TaxID=992267 RepID=A0A838XZS2_9HYPH|nr:4-hydroxy-2-oxoheptanedioate aldolase [Stappia taiwanensis]MBA4613926.1 4-hydroxy-2-oxoheptanedioate aldolase [Stappia taiwanensis]GGF07865.1 2,4-dihydroxyhept-2-ene-1,7-dioic acid aldolase [Stappia taiwanensis]